MAQARLARTFSFTLLCMAFLLVPVRVEAVEFSLSKLDIKSSAGVLKFKVEVAQSDEQRQRGLMFRDSLAPDRGMFFIFEQTRPRTMWMKNTYIPLDILFIDDKGKIFHIVRSTQPLSLSLIRSGGAAKAVLELKGGTAEKEGIEPGDEIRHPLFGMKKK